MKQDDSGINIDIVCYRNEDIDNLFLQVQDFVNKVEPVCEAYCYHCNNYFSFNLLSLGDTFACKCQRCNRQVLFAPKAVFQAIETLLAMKEHFVENQK